MENYIIKLVVYLTCLLITVSVPILLIVVGVYKNLEAPTEKAPTNHSPSIENFHYESPILKTRFKKSFQAWWHNVKYPSCSDLTGKSNHSGWTLGLSMFSSNVGLWVLTGPVELGYNCGWHAVIGYALSCAIPFFVFLVFGPILRRRTGLFGFTLNDYVKETVGYSVYAVLAFIAFLAAWGGEVGSYIAVDGYLVEMGPDLSASARVGAMVMIAMCSTVYTALGGFSASLYTDVAQGFLILLITIIAGAIIWPRIRNDIPDSIWSQANSWQSKGITAAISLNIGMLAPTFVSQYYLQKFYASRDDYEFIVAACVCALCLAPVVLFFGAFGVLTKGAVLAGVIDEPSYVGNGFYAMVKHLDPSGSSGLSVITVIFSTIVALSTCDSRVLVFGNMVGRSMEKRGISLHYSKILGFAVIVTCIVIAYYQPATIMQVMYSVNLLGCLSCAVTVMCIWSKTTIISSMVSIWSTFLTVLIFGWSYLGTFVGGFRWFLFPNGYYAWSCIWTFLACYVVNFGFLFLTGYVESHIRGDAKLTRYPFNPLTVTDTSTNRISKEFQSSKYAGHEDSSSNSTEISCVKV